MYGHRYFGSHYFGDRYFGDGGNVAGSLTAAQIAAAVWAYALEPGFSAGLMLRVIAAVAAGKTVILAPVPGSAHVTFRTISDSGDIVDADVMASERTSITITP